MSTPNIVKKIATLTRAILPNWACDFIAYFFELFRTLKSFCQRNVVVHIGISPNKYPHLDGNIGDAFLYIQMERMIESLYGSKISWSRKSIYTPFCLYHILLYNLLAKCIVIGGHGLITYDKKSKSEWIFSVPKWKLKLIRIPIFFEAIGFNDFHGDHFSKRFSNHINFCVEKAAMFQMRNPGSICALTKFLSEKNKAKLTLQPCPTTMLRHFCDIPHPKTDRSIAICLALDRFEQRFSSQFRRISADLITYVSQMEKHGFSVTFFVHCNKDLTNTNCLLITGTGHSIISLEGKSPQEVINFYSTKTLIVGMRGHSLMIPWGLNVPVISLTTQDKQSYFMSLIDETEFDIDITSPEILHKLTFATQKILANQDKYHQKCLKIQAEFWQKTQDNFYSALRLIS